jgi:hypothetical protein
MSKRKKTSSSQAMLELWRPPHGGGDPFGCLATTYTFAPALFDEQCLARFLEIESEPNREDLAFLLERESRLGGVYAGVLVDHTRAGVEHSLRWDVLPVRIPHGKQHAKLSLLAWRAHVRIIVASANLTEPGYRTNHEVAGSVDLTPSDASLDVLSDTIAFLRRVLLFVPGAEERPPEVRRAREFLTQVEEQVRGWIPIPRRARVRQHLAFTLPAAAEQASRSSLEEAVEVCRARGGSPYAAKVASPFFDANDNTDRVTAATCKLMARGRPRQLCFCVSATRDDAAGSVPWLAAPKALLLTPQAYQGTVVVEMLPNRDGDNNPRPWHAKMLALRADEYSALMIGSSNFTCAGMGVGQQRNVEANLVFVVDRVEYGREVGQLEAIWPEMEQVEEPDSAEWLEARPDQEEEEQPAAPPLPAGFLTATYHAGNERHLVLRLAPNHLPEDWSVHSCGQTGQELLSAVVWREMGRSTAVSLAWVPRQPPEKLRVCWADHEAFLPINVENSGALPAPPELDNMSADDMLLILAAVDPSAAFRAWTKRQPPPDLFDADLDSATPIDLDPLRRYDLQATFLHRIRHRARVLAQLRANLERPVWGRQALEWRLRGLVGIEPLADRLIREFAITSTSVDEALLTIADFLIVLREVDYQPSEGAFPKPEFEIAYRSFLRDLTKKIGQQIAVHRDRVPEDLMHFWDRVLDQCQG